MVSLPKLITTLAVGYQPRRRAPAAAAELQPSSRSRYSFYVKLETLPFQTGVDPG